MNKYYYQLIMRFLIILIVTFGYSAFYVSLAPITIYLSYFLLNLFYDAVLIRNSIGVEDMGFRFIEACVAPAAYYLLFVLVIGLKDLEWKKGLKMFLLGCLLILGMNLLRIIILVILNVEFGTNYFDLVHLILWNFVSGIYIAIVWIFLVKKFKVDKIPYYSDLKYFYEKSFLKKKKAKIKK
ncbi:pacearchaeosortase [Candidatus Woesearchaeota archaeon]|jgi:exosortase/archaeosortase family protein|nr:pacearchaeosortase [Candidatus Woesearchaeota archaeon]MBT4322229.1 pacearchaeosortase [Candidatus Woesearchaeota archaeon]MBT4631249.1 pacearchaeosortase [Candidatus Woesearchaeota archaeon]